MLFGKIEGDIVYAKLDDEPFVVSVPVGFLDEALNDPLQWQELPIFSFKSDEITSFSIAREGQPTLDLTRGENGWALSKGDGKVNQTNAQSLVNTLAKLRAVRWLGAKSPGDGLAKPAISVDFAARSAPGQTLRIGAVTGNNLHVAEAGGRQGVFAISAPDYTAFELPLIEKPAAPVPPTTPAATPSPDAAAPATPAPPIPAVPN
jgi:hypothetical protein